MKYLPEYWDDVKKVIEYIPNVSKLFGKRILITGATGMVCSSVIDVLAFMNSQYDAHIHILLAGRERERIMNRFQTSMLNEDYEFVKFDAAEECQLDCATDYIIHGASNANPAIYAREPVQTLLGNVIGVNSLLKLTRHNRGCRFLLISSSEVYGNRITSSIEPYRECDYGFVDILNARACYPTGKRAAETLCASYKAQFDIDFVAVRPGHIYGPSITEADTRASAAFTRDAAAGRNIVMKSDGRQLRSYCYTLDCASAILTVLLHGKNGEAYNISNRESVVSIREMANALAEAGKVEVIYDKPSDAELKSYNMMSNSALNAEKLESLGWKAIFGLQEGAFKTVRLVG